MLVCQGESGGGNPSRKVRRELGRADQQRCDEYGGEIDACSRLVNAQPLLSHLGKTCCLEAAVKLEQERTTGMGTQMHWH